MPALAFALLIAFSIAATPRHQTVPVPNSAGVFSFISFYNGS